MEDLEKLKSTAYDILVQIQNWQNELKIVTEKIATLALKEEKNKKKEDV